MPRELDTLVSCKVGQGVIESPLCHAKLCKTQSHSLHPPASVFSSAGSFALQGQDQNFVSAGLLPQIVTKKVNNLKSKILLWRRPER